MICKQSLKYRTVGIYDRIKRRGSRIVQCCTYRVIIILCAAGILFECLRNAYLGGTPSVGVGVRRSTAT